MLIEWCIKVLLGENVNEGFCSATRIFESKYVKVSLKRYYKKN
jgi:hypothetical protein